LRAGASGVSALNWCRRRALSDCRASFHHAIADATCYLPVFHHTHQPQSRSHHHHRRRSTVRKPLGQSQNHCYWAIMQAVTHRHSQNF
jgi:hypothetical protein